MLLSSQFKVNCNSHRLYDSILKPVLCNYNFILKGKQRSSYRYNIWIWISLSLWSQFWLAPFSCIWPCSATFSQVWLCSASFTPVAMFTSIGAVHSPQPVSLIHFCGPRSLPSASFTPVGLVHSHLPYSISSDTFTLIVGPVWPHSVPFRNKSYWLNWLWLTLYSFFI